MSERSGDIQPYINNLYVKAIEMNIKPSQNGTISEQQAVKLLGKSKAFLGWLDCKKINSRLCTGGQ